MSPNFTEQKHGYSKHEVDQYIELIRKEYIKVTTQNKHVASQNTQLSERLRELESSQDDLQGLLETTHAVVKNMKDEAKAKADELLYESKIKADQHTAEAEKL